jgi:hypothetical protein
MQQSNSRSLVRACVLSASASLFFAPAVFADIIASSPMLPPANSVYTLPNTCISVVCLENMQLSNFNTTSSSISGGNELTVSTVDLTANLFANVSGSPGMFISPIELTGQVDITYFDKDTLSQQGTFNAQITSLDLSGSFTGMAGTHQINAMLNPADQSTGVTTIEPLPGPPPAWNVSSFFDVFAELSIDNGPFVPGPERTASLAPEPASYAPLGAGLAMIFLLGVGRAKRLTRPSASSPAKL